MTRTVTLAHAPEEHRDSSRQVGDRFQPVSDAMRRQIKVSNMDSVKNTKPRSDDADIAKANQFQVPQPRSTVESRREAEYSNSRGNNRTCVESKTERSEGIKKPVAEDTAANEGEESEVKEKQDIVTYFAEKGLSYYRTRKNARMLVAEMSDSGGSNRGKGLYVDFYKPPAGFSDDDLPASQGHSQPPDEPVSPAILIAAIQKREQQKRVLKKVPDDGMVSKMLEMLKPRKGSTRGTEYINENHLEQLQPDCNSSFPDDNDDSFLMKVSQQVETAATVRDDRKRDVNGNKRNWPEKSVCVDEAKNMAIPFTSTPVAVPCSDVEHRFEDDTPKARTTGASRARTRSKSTNECNESPIKRVGSQEHTPRKLLKFDESCPARSGDFLDDNDDEIYSQVAIPVVEQSNYDATGSDVISSEIGEWNVTTVLFNTLNSTMDSFLHPDMMGEIDKLEAMAIISSSSNSATSSPDALKVCKSADMKPENKNMPVQVQVVTPKVMETPPSRTRRMGLSRKVRK